MTIFFPVVLFDVFLRTGQWGPFKVGIDSDTVVKLSGDKLDNSKLRKDNGCWLYGEIEFGIVERRLGYIQIDIHRHQRIEEIPFLPSTQAEELLNYLTDRSIPFVEGEPKEGSGYVRFKIGSGVYAHFNDGYLFNLIVSKSSLEEIVPGRELVPEEVDASGPNTLKNKIERLACLSDGLFVIDIKGTMSLDQAAQQIRRAEGKAGNLKGRVIILTREGILRHE